MKLASLFYLFILLLLSNMLHAQASQDLQVANGHNQYLLAGAATSDERLLATSSWEGMIIWDIASGLAIKKVKRPARTDLPFTIPGSRNFGTVHDGVIRIFDGETLSEKVVATISVFLTVGSLVVDNTGRFLYIGAQQYDGPRRAVIYKVDLKQNSAQVLNEITASSIGIANADHNTRLMFDNLSLNSDGTKICARLLVRDSTMDNYLVFNTQTLQKEKSWNAWSETIGFINNELMWHYGKTLLNKPLAAAKNGQNLSVIKYPTFQLIKTVATDLSSISTIVPNSSQIYEPATQKFHFASRRGLTTIDLVKNSATTQVTDTANMYVGFNSILLPVSKRLVQSTGAGIAAIFDPATGSKKPLGGGNPLVPSGFTSNPKNKVISIYSHKYNFFQFIDLRSEVIKIYNHDFRSSTPVTWSPDGKKGVFYSYVGNKMGFFNGDDPAAAPAITPAPEYYGMSAGIQFSPDGKYFAVGPSQDIFIWDAVQNKQLRRLPGSQGFVGGSLCFSSDGTTIVSCILNKSAADPKKADYVLQCHRVKDGVKLWETKATENIHGFAFTNGDNSIFAFSSNATYSFDAATGAAQRKNTNNKVNYISSFSPDRKFLYSLQPNKLDVIDVQTGSVAYSIPSSSNHSGGYATVLAGAEFVVGTNEDNSLHFYDLKRKADVGKIFTFSKSEEYAFISRNNYFEGTQEATSKMYFVKDNRILPLESLFEKFYSPRILQSVFARTEPGPPVVNINTIKGAPTAKISYALGKRNLVVEDDKAPANTVQQSNVTITVQATAPGDKISEIRLYQNGKLIASNTRNLEVADDNEGLEKRNYEVLLQPGSNSFSAVSINSQRTESMPAQISLSYIGANTSGDKNSNSVAANTSTSTTMYLVIIGINQYKNTRYNLNYAVADAKGFQEKINAGCGTLMKECKPFFISNDQATKENIVKTLQNISGMATAKDLLVFYYAGHGVMNDAAQKEFYLVPYDVTQLYGNDAGLSAKGISSSELLKLSTNIKAQKQLFILDACQSAGALQQVASRGAAEEKAIAQLARSTGTHWLTASGSDQFASEFDKLGHGAFTYVLMNGLAGEAAMAGGSITVNSLKAYIETKVPEITEQYKGTPQYPASYGFGQDFPIGVKK